MKNRDYSRSTGSASALRARILRALALSGQAALLVLATIVVTEIPAFAVVTFTKSFGAPTIPVNGTTSLTFNLANNFSFLVTDSFNDTLPAGLVVATPNGLTTVAGCNGTPTIMATAGSSSVSMSGATFISDCHFSVNVTGKTAGVKNNSVTETISSSTATASLTVVTPITVTTLDEPTGPGGTCSLRQAITNANGKNTSGSTNCAAGTGTDIIQFGVTGKITLGSTLPAIVNGETLTIQGPGITIDGDSAVQLMQVNSGATLTLQNLTLQNGSDVGASGSSGNGGAITNQGTLTVTDCTLSNNQATGGAGSIGGPGQGGAIFNSGTLTITNSTLSSNFATGGATSLNPNSGGIGTGGAIYNFSGTLTVTNTTFSGNEATGGFGTPGQGGEGAGGAIFIKAGTLTMTNATFSGNQAIDGGPGAERRRRHRQRRHREPQRHHPRRKHSPTAVQPPSPLATASPTTPCFTSGTMGNVRRNNQRHRSRYRAGQQRRSHGDHRAAPDGGTANAFIHCPLHRPVQPAVTLMTDQRGFPRPAPSHSDFCSAGAFEYNPPFFNGEVASVSLYYLTFPTRRSWLLQLRVLSVALPLRSGVRIRIGRQRRGGGSILYDTLLGSWLYTNPSDFPIMWDYTLTHWLYYFAGTSRTFYDFTTDMYFTNPPG